MEQLAIQVHVITAFTAIFIVVVTDLYALLWVLGKRTYLSARVLTLFHRLIWTALGIMVVSGGVMFSSYGYYLVTAPAFLIKMGFVAALIVNAFVIGQHMHIASERSFKELERNERRPLFISGAVSTISWIGAFIAAQFLGLGL